MRHEATEARHHNVETTTNLLKEAARLLSTQMDPLADLLDLVRTSAGVDAVGIYRIDPRGNYQCIAGPDSPALRHCVRQYAMKLDEQPPALVSISASRDLWLASDTADPSACATLQTLAPMVAIALRQSELARESRQLRTQADRQERRNAELATLYDVSRSLAAASGAQKAAEKVTELAARISDSDSALLLLFDADCAALRAAHWTGVSEAIEKSLRWMSIPLPVAAQSRTVTSPRLLRRDDCADLFGPEWSAICRAFVESNQSTVLVPLAIESVAVGILLLGKNESAYTGTELTLLAVASSQAAAVLRSAAVYERHIGRRELELSAVFALIQRLRAAVSIDEALVCILDIVGSLVWSERSALYTIDPDGAGISVRVERGTPLDPEAKTFPIDSDAVAARALRERRGLIASNDEAGVPTALALTLAIPLSTGDETIGVVTLESRRSDVYTDDHVMTLHLVASQAATIYREISSFRILSRYTENILQCIAAGVVTIGKDGAIVTWNARAEEIVNLRADQVIGMDYRKFIEALQIDESERDETIAMVELTAQTGTIYTRRQLCYHSPQGDETYANLSISQLRSQSGEYLGVVIVFEDVTREVQMKEEVERIGKLAETGQLAANIAHELRNPLASIKAAAQILRKNVPEGSAEEVGEFVDIIVDEVNGLNRMATDFLDFSRISPPHFEAIDINAALTRLVQSMSGYLSDNRVMATCELAESLPDTYIDRALMDQVVRNIVINAVQAMPDGGQLTVRSLFDAANETVEIDVTDTGCGIPPLTLGRIWTPFYTTKTKGTGLGLAIARKIVDDHGGRVLVASTPGEGSTFRIQLPVRPLQAPVWAPGRADIDEQRSDRPGGYFQPPRDDLGYSA